MFFFGPLNIDMSVLYDQKKLIYISPVLTQDVVWKTSQVRWTIVMDGKRLRETYASSVIWWWWWYVHIYMCVHIVIHRQICFILSEFISVARQARFPKLGSKPCWLKRQSKILPLSHKEASASEVNLNAYESQLLLFTYICLTATESLIHMNSLAYTLMATQLLYSLQSSIYIYICIYRREIQYFIHILIHICIYICACGDKILIWKISCFSSLYIYIYIYICMYMGSICPMILVPQFEFGTYKPLHWWSLTLSLNPPPQL